MQTIAPIVRRAKCRNKTNAANVPWIYKPGVIPSRLDLAPQITISHKYKAAVYSFMHNSNYARQLDYVLTDGYNMQEERRDMFPVTEKLFGQL